MTKIDRKHNALVFVAQTKHFVLAP